MPVTVVTNPVLTLSLTMEPGSLNTSPTFRVIELAPIRLITGGDRSVTVTVAWAWPLLPDKSVAVNVTTVAPSGKVRGALLDTGLDPSTASLAVAAFRKAVMPMSLLTVPLASVAATVILEGGVTSGATLSTTLTVRVTSTAAFPAPSLALYFNE